MLVKLPKNIPLYHSMYSTGCWNNLYHAAERYLSLSNRVAVIERSQNNFHEATLLTHKRTFSSFACSLVKVLSYALVLLPLIAVCIKAAGRKNQSYYYHVQGATTQQLAFVQAFQKNNLESMKKLYKLDPTVVDLKLQHSQYGNISLCFAACLGEKIQTLDWLLSIQGRAMLDEVHEGTSLLIMTALENKQETMEWLLKQGCDPQTAQDSSGTSLFTLASLQPTPEIAWILLRHTPDLLYQKNDEGITSFESALISLSSKCKTTHTIQWLYQEGAGRGLFIKACKENDLVNACKLFDAIGEPILQETNEKGMNHFERACYDGNLRLVTTLFNASKGAVRNLYIDPKCCKGGVLRFIYQNGCA